jgi:hypothetical protein
MMARTIAIVSIIFVAAASRLVPHPWNVSPMLALALFGGAYLGNRVLAFGIPLVAMFLSDLALAGRYGAESFIDIPFTYSCYILTVIFGWWVREKQYNPGAIFAAALSSSILFFVVTNFGTWVGGYWRQVPFYPMNLQGLTACYVAGIPFFRDLSLPGDMAFTVILFGGLWVVERTIAALQKPSPVDTQSPGEKP